MDFLPDNGEASRRQSGAIDDEEEPPDTFSGLQGEGGAGAYLGRRRTYVEHHAAREDTVVFPAWKDALSAHQLDEMGELFEEIEPL